MEDSISIGKLISKNSRFDLLEGQDHHGRNVWIKRSNKKGRHEGPGSIDHEFHILQGAELDGAHVIHDKITLEGQPALIFEAVDGIALEDVLKGPLPLDEFFDLANLVTGRLISLHSELIFHLNLSPEVIFVSTNRQSVQLIDFGYAFASPVEGKLFAQSVDQDFDFLYAAPEQTGRTFHRVDSRADIYALGLIFYRMLTGQSAFPKSQTARIIHHHLSSHPDSPARINELIPEPLSDLVMKMIRKNPSDRYQSVSCISRDLRKIQAHIQKGHSQNQNIELGLDDAVYEFDMPEKLFGRKDDINFLLDGHESEISSGRVIFVEGEQGIGKSQLIRFVFEGNKVLGLFEEIRCDANKVTSYGAFLHLVNSLILELGSKGRMDDDLMAKLNELLVHEGQKLLSLFPSLQDLLDKNIDGNISNEDSGRPVQELIHSILSAIATSERPVVLFLDEYHNCDAESKQFIRELIQLEMIPFLVVICAVNKSKFPQFSSYTIELLERAKVPLHILELKALRKKEFKRVVQEIMGDGGEHKALIEYLFGVSKGNLKFLKELLVKSIEVNALIYNPEKLKWEYDLDLIQNIDIPTSSFDLIVERYERLDNQGKELLSTAAVFGKKFTTEVLAEVSPEYEVDLQQYLDQFVDQGFLKKELEKISISNEKLETKYHFAANDLENRIYSSVGKGTRSDRHFAIGQMLLSYYDRSGGRSGATDIARHLEKVDINKLKSLDQKKLIHVLEQAAVQARNTMGLEEASTYYQLIFDLAGSSLSDGKLCQLKRAAGQSSYLDGDYKAGTKLLDEAYSLASSDLDKAKILQNKMDLLNQEGKLDDVMKTGLKALNILGVNIDSKASQLSLLKTIIKIAWAHRGKDFEYFKTLPRMTDPKMLLAHEILLQALSWSLSQGPEMLGAMVLKIHELTLKYGNSDISYAGYGGYGAVLSEGFKMDKKGMDYIFLGLDISRQFDESLYKYRGIGAAGGTMVYRTHKWSETGHYALVSLEKAKEYGDHTNYASLSFLISDQLLSYGRPLSELKERVDEFYSYAKIRNYRDMEIFHGIRTKKLDELTSKSKKHDIAYDELKNLINKTAYGYVKISSCNVALLVALLKDHESDMFAILETAETYKHNAPVSVLNVCYAVMRSMVMAVLFFKANDIRKTPIKKINQDLNLLERFAKNVPDDFLGYKVLVEAVKIAVSGNLNDALEHLDNDVIWKEDNLLLKVLASKLQFEVQQKIDGLSSCEYDLKRYHKALVAWGASRVADELESKYDAIWSNGSRGKESSSFDLDEYIDVQSVLQATTILAEDINLDSLVQNLLKVMAENSGASHGKLILVEDSHLDISADLFPDGEEAESSDEIPISIIKRSAFENAIVILDRRNNQINGTVDSYFESRNVQCLISLPIVKQGKVLGVVYLENRYVDGVFTRERLNVLKAIAVQAAVSIQNAEQYNRILKLNAAYEKFVPREFLRFLDKGSILDIQLGDQARRNMSIMFSDIRDFTSLSEKLSPQENFNFINEYLSEMEPIIKENKGFIDKYIGDSIMALFPVDPINAVRCAVQMNQKLNEINVKRNIDLRVGYGINTGDLMIGIIGGYNRMESTVISDTVNIAARIESLTKFYHCPVLISEHTYDAIKDRDEFYTRKVDNVVAKGKTKPVGLYEVLTDISSDMDKVWLDAYHYASSAFVRADFQTAINAYTVCLNERPLDKVCQLYIASCHRYMEEGVDENWQHVTIAQTK